MRRLVSIKPVFIVIGAQFFITLFQFSFFPYFAIYLQNNGLDPYLVSTLLGIKSLSEMVGILAGGLYADSPSVGRYTSYGFLLLAGAYSFVAIAHSWSTY